MTNSKNNSRDRVCGCTVFSLCNMRDLVSSLCVFIVLKRRFFFNQIIDQTKFMLLLPKGFDVRMTDDWKYVCSQFLFSISLLFYFLIKTNQDFFLARRGIIKFAVSGHESLDGSTGFVFTQLHVLHFPCLSVSALPLQFSKSKCPGLQEGTKVTSLRS